MFRNEPIARDMITRFAARQCFDNVDYSNGKIDQPFIQFPRRIHAPILNLKNQISPIINRHFPH